MIDREKVYWKYGGRCAYCGQPLTKQHMQVDHIKPKALGGTDAEDNLNPSCQQCNHYKDTKSVEQFRSELQQLLWRLEKRGPVGYRLAKRYGLVKEEKKPVTFFYEIWDGKNTEGEREEGQEEAEPQCGNCAIYGPIGWHTGCRCKAGPLIEAKRKPEARCDERDCIGQPLYYPKGGWPWAN